MKDTTPAEKSEKKIQQEILIALNKTYADRLRLWRNNVGKGYGAWIVQKAIKQLTAGQPSQALQTLRQSRPITYGVPGSPDLQGFLRLGGKAVSLGIEVKKDSGQQSDLQGNYEKMILAFGGLYFVARSADQAVEYVRQIIERHD